MDEQQPNDEKIWQSIVSKMVFMHGSGKPGEWQDVYAVTPPTEAQNVIDYLEGGLLAGFDNSRLREFQLRTNKDTGENALVLLID